MGKDYVHGFSTGIIRLSYGFNTALYSWGECKRGKEKRGKRKEEREKWKSATGGGGAGWRV